MADTRFEIEKTNGTLITLDRDGSVRITMDGTTCLEFVMTRPPNVTGAPGSAKPRIPTKTPGLYSPDETLITQHDTEALNNAWANMDPPPGAAPQPNTQSPENARPQHSWYMESRDTTRRTNGWVTVYEQCFKCRLERITEFNTMYPTATRYQKDGRNIALYPCP